MKPVAIVPAAGIGTRLRPHTHTVPKALLHVAGKPILAHIVDELRSQGVERTIVVTGYMGDRVRAYLQDRYPRGVETVEQPQRLGLGHAIAMAADEVRSGPVLIILGDTIVEPRWRHFLSGDEAVIGVREVADPRRFGVVEVNGTRVVRLIEKPRTPPSNLAIVGVYYLPDAAPLFDELRALIGDDRRTREEYQLTDALQQMLIGGVRMRVSAVEGWYDCGTTDTLLATNRHLLQRAPQPEMRPGVTIIPPVLIDPRAQVESAVIGPHVSIAADAQVRDAIIRDAIINVGARVEAMLLERSVVGENAVVRGSFPQLNVGDNSAIDSQGPPS